MCGTKILSDADYWRLAERLYFTLEKLDPHPDSPSWDALSPDDRELYWHCARAMAQELAALPRMK